MLAPSPPLSSSSFLPFDWADGATAAVLSVSRNGCVLYLPVQSSNLWTKWRSAGAPPDMASGVMQRHAESVASIQSVSHRCHAAGLCPACRSAGNVCLAAWCKQKGGVRMAQREVPLKEMGDFCCLLSCHAMSQSIALLLLAI